MGGATVLVRRAYAAAISYVDAQVGVVLDALEDAHLSESTAVVLFGDHGWQLGERGEFAKYSVAELAARVPLIVRLPQGAGAFGSTVAALGTVVARHRFQ